MEVEKVVYEESRFIKVLHSMIYDDLSLTDIGVYIALRSFGTENCWPSQKKIKELTGCDERVIRLAIDKLKAKKYVETKPHGRGVQYFFLKDDGGFEQFGFKLFERKDIKLPVKVYFLLMQQFSYIEMEKDGTFVSKCHYSMSEICDRLKLNYRTVKRYDTILEENGLMKNYTDGSLMRNNQPVKVHESNLTAAQQIFKGIANKITNLESRVTDLESPNGKVAKMIIQMASERAEQNVIKLLKEKGVL